MKDKSPKPKGKFGEVKHDHTSGEKLIRIYDEVIIINFIII